METQKDQKTLSHFIVLSLDINLSDELEKYLKFLSLYGQRTFSLVEFF